MKKSTEVLLGYEVTIISKLGYKISVVVKANNEYGAVLEMSNHVAGDFDIYYGNDDYYVSSVDRID